MLYPLSYGRTQGIASLSRLTERRRLAAVTRNDNEVAQLYLVGRSRVVSRSSGASLQRPPNKNAFTKTATTPNRYPMTAIAASDTNKAFGLNRTGLRIAQVCERAAAFERTVLPRFAGG